MLLSQPSLDESRLHMLKRLIVSYPWICRFLGIDAYCSGTRAMSWNFTIYPLFTIAPSAISVLIFACTHDDNGHDDERITQRYWASNIQLMCQLLTESSFWNVSFCIDPCHIRGVQSAHELHSINQLFSPFTIISHLCFVWCLPPSNISAMATVGITATVILYLSFIHIAIHRDIGRLFFLFPNQYSTVSLHILKHKLCNITLSKLWLKNYYAQNKMLKPEHTQNKPQLANISN